MTTQSISSEEIKDLSNSSPMGIKEETVDPLLSGDAYGSSMETDAIKIVDPGVGKEVILRHFFFKSPPDLKHTPTKLELVSAYKRMIELTLWKDGLIVRDDKPIEVHTIASAKKVSKSLYTKMRMEGSDFVILVLAEPRMGVNVIDTIHRAK